MREKFLAIGLPLFFFLLPWQTRWIFGQELIVGEPFSFGVMSLYVTEVIVLMIFLATMVGKKWKWPLRPASAKLLVAFLLACLVSLLFAQSVSLGAAHLLHIVFASMLFAVLLDRRVNVEHVAIAFVAGLIIPIGLGVFQFLVGSSDASMLLGLAARDAQALGDSIIEIGEGRVLRAYGSLPHPNIFGGYLVVGLLLLLGFNHHALKKHGWSFLLVLALMVIGLVLTFSRSAWLALAIVGVIWMTHRLTVKKKRNWNVEWKRIVVGGVIVLFASALWPSVIDRVAVDGSSASVTERLAQYEDWSETFPQAWLFGHGVGNYTLAVEATDGSREWWQYQPVHNTPLLLLAEVGLVGLVLLISFCVFALRGNIDVKKRAVPLLACLALVVISLFDHYLWTTWSGLALTATSFALLVRHN